MAGVAEPWRVSSDGRAASPPLESLRETIGRRFLHADFHFVGERPRFDCTLWQLGDVAILRGSASHVRIASPADPDAGDAVILAAGFGAPSLLRHRGREIASGDGTAMLVKAAEPRSAESADGYEPRHIRLPAARLAPFVAGLDDKIMRPLRPCTPALRLLEAYLPLACAAEVIADPLLATRAADHVCDLVALALGASADTGQAARARTLDPVRSAAMRQWIRRRLQRGDLSLTELARAHALAPRTVQAIFHTEGTSFSAVLLAERLELAHRLLAAPAARARSIADLAFACGFADLSWFNRSFRRRFGCTPGDVRAAATATAAAP